MVPSSIFCGGFHNYSRPVFLGCISMTDISTALYKSLCCQWFSQCFPHNAADRPQCSTPSRQKSKSPQKPYKLQIKISKHGANEDNDDNIDSLFVASKQFLIKDTTHNAHLYKLLSRATSAQRLIYIPPHNVSFILSSGTRGY